MRLLYLRHADRGARHRATAPGRGRAPDPGRAFRQSVPVHGISGHHQRGGKRARVAPVETRGRHIRGGRAASSSSCLRADWRSRAAVDDRASARGRRGTHGLDTVRGKFRGGEIAATVWAIFADIPAVAACLDGAKLTEHDANSAKGKMTVKLGPIQAGFSGSAVIEHDDQALRGIIRGAGSDRGTGSRTKGEIVYRLTPEADGRQTRVSVTVEYSLQGPLAQFSRSGLVLALC